MPQRRLTCGLLFAALVAAACGEQDDGASRLQADGQDARLAEAPDALRRFHDALAVENEDAVDRAAQAVATLVSHATDALASAAGSDRPATRNAAIRALLASDVAARRASQQVMTLLASAPGDTVSEDASRLVRFGGAAVPVLRDALQARSGIVRARAAWALGLINPPPVEAVHDLLLRLYDLLPEVRRRAAYSLERVLAAVPEGERAQASLAHLAAYALSDSEPQVRASVANVLGIVGSDAAPHVGELTRLLGNDPSPGVRRHVVGALVSIAPESPEVLVALAAARNDVDATVRSAADGALKASGR